MLTKLPGLVVDNDTSVREEVAHLRGLSADDLWHLTIACSNDAMWATKLGGMMERGLAYVDPLPESTVSALARLRRQAGWGDGR